MRKSIVFTLLVLISFRAADGRSSGEFILESPDKSIVLKITPSTGKTGEGLAVFTIRKGQKEILLPSFAGLVLKDTDLREDLEITGTALLSQDKTWINEFGERREVRDNYNQLTIRLRSRNYKFNLVCRAYNEGLAFAWDFPKQKNADTLRIASEEFTYWFQEDYPAWSAPRAQAMYNRLPLSKIDKGCERPLVIEYDNSLTIALAEARLVDFARMKFDPLPGDGFAVKSRLDGEVALAPPFTSPWRVIMIGKNPGDLLEKNYLLLNLNDPSEIKDVSWIKPGKVLREVTLTTSGAKAAIDYTSTHGMQYVEFDAGWYGPENNDMSDARSVNLDPARSKGPLDIEEVIDYANSRGIKILLYVNRRALEKQIDDLLPIYKKWGIAGIKFGFVQVGSQEATAWLHESIRKVARYGMVADVHDEYRPTGFSRTYPNFLTMEGIRGDEESPANSHTLITMFTRMLAGQGDNTICYYNDRVEKKMGSHASQLAKAVCIFSPLQFIYWYDKASPKLNKDDGLWGTTNYIGDEPETVFFARVPTVWDETRVLLARPGETGVIARRKGNEWFIGGINGEKPADIEISFSFLDSGKAYDAKIYSDDPSVETRTHVRIDSKNFTGDENYKVHLDPNNGFAMHLVPAK